MPFPSAINLTTADATDTGGANDAGWKPFGDCTRQVNLAGTWGGATCTLQTYDTPNTAWISTGDTWTANAAPRIAFSTRALYRFNLTTAGSGADIDIEIL